MSSDSDAQRAAGGLRVERESGLVRLVIDNPSTRNALTLEMVRQLESLVRDADAMPHVALIVLTGAGDTFSSGLDIAALERYNTEPVDEAPEALFARLLETLADASTPLVALVDGPAYGGGMQLAASCDFRFATPQARFAVPAASLAVVYAASGLRVLRDVIGTTATKRLLYTGVALDAYDAHRIGLVDMLGSYAEIALEASRLADALFAGSAVSVGAVRQLLSAIGRGEDTESLEQAWTARLDPDERAEGLRARRDRDRPRFPSRQSSAYDDGVPPAYASEESK